MCFLFSRFFNYIWRFFNYIWRFFNYIWRFFDNIWEDFKSMDEKRKRWVKSGILQLPISLAMVVIGLVTRASCKIDNVSTVLIIMGGVMSILALCYIVLGCYTYKCVAFSNLSYWPIAVIAIIVQFSLQIWACKYDLCPPFTQYCSFNYDVESSENFCPFWPIRSAIFILTIDVVYSLSVLLKIFITFPYMKCFAWCFDKISKCFNKCFRKSNMQTDQNPTMEMSDVIDPLIDNTNAESENENHTG